jgi:hypothetical protein
VQPGEVHTGLTQDPERTLTHLFAGVVERASPVDELRGSGIIGGHT